MNKCENIICPLVDSAADSKLKRLKPGETFGVEKPGGESRIYVGQISNERIYDNFFGLKNDGGIVTFKVSVSDLVNYIIQAKDEFLNPINSYRLDISQLYDTLVSDILALKEDFTISFAKNTDSARYYLSPYPKGRSEYGKIIKPICLPLLTSFNFIKTVSEEDNVSFYFKLIYNSPKEEDTLSYLEDIEHEENEKNITSRQIIYYGAPGTGKSHKIKGLVTKGNHVRTTFHPDSDYASFVGAYKPTMIEISSRDMAGHVIHDGGKEVTEKKIVYEFVAQSFLQAYTEAWKRSVGKMTDKEGNTVDKPEDMSPRYYLVIEEINRGNCAQIFGDLFQLLDRDDNGESSYAIRPDQDIKRYLAEQFAGLEELPEEIRSGVEMKLPGNLYIFATMNTSDQSLFPIDSAFKRRWDWEYVPIKDENKGYYIKVADTAYLWNDFISKINDTILSATESDDKQMGYWFVHLPEGEKEITTDKFVGKVLFYLWNDVFKDYGDGEDTIFIGERLDGTKYDLRFKNFFTDQRDEHIKCLMRYNKVDESTIESADVEEIAGEEGLEKDTPTADGKPSVAGQAHQTFWTLLKTTFNERNVINDTQKAATDNWHNVALGITGVLLCFKHNIQKGFVTAEVWIEKKSANEFLDFINPRKDAIDSKFSSIPVWRSAKTVSMIGWQSPTFNLTTAEGNDQAKEWLVKSAEELYNVFVPIISEYKQTK